ncbi:hypothetical protein CRG98_025938 [Punica granatum]|uniref:Uncharacterized protein n=1 Tax=Punica granatum TaxID=22663 RepID=A0A2I0JBT5_PUNGR|nr:hypothetical protein CRG98_025938 [Punica granatum]
MALLMAPSLPLAPISYGYPMITKMAAEMRQQQRETKVTSILALFQGPKIEWINHNLNLRMTLISTKNAPWMLMGPSHLITRRFYASPTTMEKALMSILPILRHAGSWHVKVGLPPSYVFLGWDIELGWDTETVVWRSFQGAWRKRKWTIGVTKKMKWIPSLRYPVWKVRNVKWHMKSSSNGYMTNPDKIKRKTKKVEQGKKRKRDAKVEPSTSDGGDRKEVKKYPVKGEMVSKKHSRKAATSRAAGIKARNDPKLLKQSIQKEKKRH